MFRTCALFTHRHNLEVFEVYVDVDELERLEVE
jgi:DUF1365 family protein